MAPAGLRRPDAGVRLGCGAGEVQAASGGRDRLAGARIVIVELALRAPRDLAQDAEVEILHDRYPAGGTGSEAASASGRTSADCSGSNSR